MSERRQVWQTLSNLISRLEQDIEQLGNGRTGTPTPTLEGLEKEVRKLGKVQLKANTLAENQLTQAEQLLDNLKRIQVEEETTREALIAQQTAAARHELLLAFLPALDSIEHALSSGQRYLGRRDKAAQNPNLSPTQAQLVSPADRAMLSGWLDGLSLTRDRLLAVLEAGGVTPIAAVGQTFDPFLHRAVGVTVVAALPPGTVVAEERTGYQSETAVLRFADVVVNRPKA